MSGFFSKLFGGAKSGTSATRSANSGEGSDALAMVEETIAGVIERAGFNLEYTATSQINGEIEDILVEFSGDDEEILTAENGEMLDSFQLFAKRVLQHKLSEARVEVHTDANGFREKATQSLVDMTEKLKDKCLESGKSQYMRPLAPKDRKTVHQHLATDERVRSRSIGEGHFKKVKIYPAKSANAEQDSQDDAREESRGNSRGPRGGGRGNSGGNGPRGNGNGRNDSRPDSRPEPRAETRAEAADKELYDSHEENFGNR
jgi:spoIIIJ-associated protein